MGWTLAELGQRMTSAEFSLHLQREIDSQPKAAQEPESDWCDGM